MLHYINLHDTFDVSNTYSKHHNDIHGNLTIMQTVLR